MPRVSARPCSTPGCPELVSNGKCPAHAKVYDVSLNRKGTAVYNTKRWQVRRRAFLAEHPRCVAMLCLNMATNVDHVLPIGTPGVDPFDESNWQPLCAKHHSAKTIREVVHFK